MEITKGPVMATTNYLLWELTGATWYGNEWKSPNDCKYGWVWEKSYLGVTSGHLHSNFNLTVFWGDGEIGNGEGGQRATFYTYRRTI